MLPFRRKIFLSQFLLTGLFGYFFCSCCNVKRFFWAFALYAPMSGWILYRITAPLQRIIDVVISLKEEELPDAIAIDQSMFDGEFGKLGGFFNSLIERIKKQIRRAQEQKKESEEILHSLEEGVIAVDTSGVVTFANGTACKMLQISDVNIVGNSLQSFHFDHKSLTQICHELIQQVLQTSEVVAWNWSDSEKRTCHLRLVGTPRSCHNGMVLVIQDKTSDYKMVEIGKDFIANASHELKTPITIICGFAETLQEHPNLPTSMVQEIGEKVVRTSSRLEKLIKSLLTLAEIENVSLEKFQMVDLVSLAFLCKQQFMYCHPDISLEIEVAHSPFFIVADPLLLELAVMNLLENAAKYSSHPARIHLSIRKENTFALLKVRDEGIGIPNEDLPHIFERFYTVDKARSRKSGGAGLGLAIVRTIIEKHNGKVSVVSELAKGSTFTLAVPLKTI